MPSHYEESLQRDIGRLRAKIGDMLQLVLRALTDSLEAFLETDRPRAYLVVLRDRHIDELEKEIDRLSLEFIVRQQPVASHLRFVYASIKINQALERIGDYCESISRQSLKIIHLDVHFLHDRYREMMNLAIPMLRDAVTAFLTQDLELARKAMQSEKAVDNLRTVIGAEVAKYQQEGRIPVEAIIPLLTISKRIERTSDQAENICEEVIYLCTGEYAKHKGREVFRILFVDEDNACLSQMAEAIGNSLNQPRFLFSSAGLKPASPDSGTLEFLKKKGLNVSRQSSKSLNQIPNLEFYQVAVAFGESVQNRLNLPTKTVELDWTVPDPCGDTGHDADSEARFEAAFRYIETHIRDLTQAILGDDVEPTRING
ncbi:MAG: phosphate signaling complex protein PhoU [Acidobacteria bacterium]|nr:MAG: phosphate signaling complex protein PhoU [Acidobacteriota bacterium]